MRVFIVNIRVGIPSYSGKLFPRTFDSIRELSSYEAEGVSFEVLVVPQCYSAAEGRNIAVTRGDRHKKQKMNFDYYLSMDADNACTIADILMLLDRNLDIVSAAYLMRSSRLSSTIDRYVAAQWHNGVPGIAGKEDYLPVTTTGLVQVDTMGLGCCLIKAAVFESMEYPYFRVNIVDELVNGEALSMLVPDDISFSINVEKYGFKKYLDADVVIFHDPGNDER